MTSLSKVSDVSELLASHGPALTSDIAARLRENGKSPEAARQSVSRLPPGVRVLHGIPFPKRARFIYLEQQFGTDQYWAALIKAIDTSSPAYAAALSALKTRGALVLLRHFDIVSGAPVRQKGQISSDTILARLTSAKLVSTIEIDGIGQCVTLADEESSAGFALPGMRARMLTEGVLLDAIRQWAGRMNMASPKATKIRDEVPSPQFGTFRFDLCGPSYLRPLARTRESKTDPGFLVADVLLNNETLDEAAVAPFLRKCATLSHLHKIRPFLPMLIADSFTPEALRACRSRGIIATRPETLFGRDVAEALADLFKTLSNAAAMAAANPDRVENLFKRLSAIEGSAGNLRGALFELLVGHVVRSVEGGSIDIGVLVTDPRTGQKAEIDVRLVKERTVIVYECKGYQPSSTIRKDEIEEWLSKRIAIINATQRYEQRFDGCEFRFEYWTCGTFDEEAVAQLEAASIRTRKYAIGWKDGAAVREYAKAIKAPGIRKILNEHYFEHALAGLDDMSQMPTESSPQRRAQAVAIEAAAEDE